MSREQRFDLCVIGAGSGGLTVAAGAAQMGASVVLVERGRMGGDCLNFGCVPSKALLAAGHAADDVRRSVRFGVHAGPPAIDGAGVHRHVHGVIAAIAPHDSVERFERLGVTVIAAHARFLSPETLEAGGRCIRARRFVVATGSSPRVPGIPGLTEVPFLTNETVFDLRDIPRSLLVLGGGPVGAELAQAYRQLGAEVAIIEQGRILAREDAELAAVVRARLLEQGLALHERATVIAVRPETGEIALSVAGEGGARELRGSHLLVAAGRTPCVDGLDLDRAGVAFTEAGITVDGRLRTSNRRIFAIGDVIGGPQFTHLAGFHGQIVLRNALFRLPARADHAVIPRVTYTEPELAQVGGTETEATMAGVDVRVLRAPFQENDRARAALATSGLVKVIVDRRGRILGAGIVGPAAGDLVQTWVLAMSRRLRIGAVATMIAPYPTLGEANKGAAGQFFAPKLFNKRIRFLVRLLARFG